MDMMVIRQRMEIIPHAGLAFMGLTIGQFQCQWIYVDLQDEYNLGRLSR